MPLLRFEKRSFPPDLPDSNRGTSPLDVALKRVQSRAPRALSSRAIAFGSALLSTALLSSTASADEPPLPGEPAIFRDSAVDLLEVADAFDVKDSFDINLRLAFEHESRSAPIRRESSIAQPGLTAGGTLGAGMDVATYYEATQRLIPEINIGIFRDFALTIKMPVILSNTRRLDERNGSASQPFATAGLEGEQLFSTNFQSPTRSGIEHLAVGIDWGIMNQFRNPAHPNWVIGIEARFNVSEPMRACNENPADGQVKCAYDADINRNGVNDPLDSDFGPIAGSAEGNFEGERSPGVSRGTTALEAHAYVSKRLGYIEPYTGVEAEIEYQGNDTAFGAFDANTAVVNHPPIKGTFIAGLAVIPWEQPEKSRRLSIDMRIRGTYVSEGRDYSELFDALGSSDAASLRNPNFTSYSANTDPLTISESPSILDPAGSRGNFSGLTNVQAHGDYELKAEVSWQASRYVKFDLGAAWRIIQDHFITADTACNPDVTSQVERSGPCAVDDTTPEEDAAGNTAWVSGGLPSPHYRKVLNDTGNRFLVEASHGFRGWVRASVLF